MNEVPNIISTKDLSYLEDMFNWHLNASKKANHFSKEVTESDCQAILDECATMHAACARKINGILKGGQNG